MFDDSFAPSHTPDDLFHPNPCACMITPYRKSYFIELQADQSARVNEQVESTKRVKELVDISREQSAEFFQ